jgi:DNA-binding response OmpR family regulator
MAVDELLQSLVNEALLPEPSVLLVEDDHDVARTQQRFIERAGMRTAWASTGADALRLKESFRPDIVLVDLGLPDMDGGNLVRWLAAKGDCGVIVVSGRGEEVERVVGLALGADDYITKPPPLREMVERIRAVHRRLARAQPAAAATAGDPAEVVLGAVRVDLRRRSVTGRGAAAIHLTAAEFEALEALIKAAPQPVSREKLCRLALRRPFHAEDRGVDQLVLNLRRKLFDDDSAHSVIVSVRGAGYAITIDKDLLAAGAAAG